MNSRKVIESFNCAIEGIIEAIKKERHMRIHLLVTIFVIIISIAMNLTKIEMALIVFAVALVWIAEIFNTAIEAVVDLYIKEYHDLAKLAKDTAAGGVFVAAVASVIIGYLVMFNHMELFAKDAVYKIKTSPAHASAIAIIMVTIIVIGTKAMFRKGRPLHGGMPSGHAALAFSAWASIVFLTDNIYIVILSFFMAALVSQTRVKAGIHTFAEVIVGASLGFIVTFGVLFFIKHM